MGYMTRYSLSWEPQPGREEISNCAHVQRPKSKFCQECGTLIGKKPLDGIVANYITSFGDMDYAINTDGSSEESCKWYYYFDDMLKMSTEIPEVLFELHGEGEESGDLWNAYFLNGRGHVSYREITYAPFDARKLSTTRNERATRL